MVFFFHELEMASLSSITHIGVKNAEMEKLKLKENYNGNKKAENKGFYFF